MGFVGKQESQYLITPSSLIDKVNERFERRATGVTGDLLPWSKTHPHIQFRPGEVSIWCGYNGHGKSLLLGQVFAWLLGESRLLTASLEMLPETTCERMIRQSAGSEHPTQGWRERWLRWTDNRLWLYDQTDTVPAERILAMTHYAAEKLECAHIAIDSLMKCGVPGRNSDARTEGQKDFVDRLCWVAKTHLTHIHLVHHMRKGETEKVVPDKMDVRGEGTLVDMVDNLFMIHRNKRKEELVAAGETIDPKTKKPLADAPDASLLCAKQRNGEWEGRVNLWYEAGSMQYTGRPDAGRAWWPWLRDVESYDGAEQA